MKHDCTNGKQVCMNEQKSLLEIFQVSQKEVDALLHDYSNKKVSKIVYNYNGDGKFPMEEELYKTAKRLFGKEKADLIMMYLAFCASLELRGEIFTRVMIYEPPLGHWKKIRLIEELFLGYTKTAERVPPDVLAIAYVIAHYWSYLDFLQPGAD